MNSPTVPDGGTSVVLVVRGDCETVDLYRAFGPYDTATADTVVAQFNSERSPGQFRAIAMPLADTGGLMALKPTREQAVRAARLRRRLERLAAREAKEKGHSMYVGTVRRSASGNTIIQLRLPKREKLAPLEIYLTEQEREILIHRLVGLTWASPDEVETGEGWPLGFTAADNRADQKVIITWAKSYRTERAEIKLRVVGTGGVPAVQQIRGNISGNTLHLHGQEEFDLVHALVKTRGRSFEASEPVEFHESYEEQVQKYLLYKAEMWARRAGRRSL